jgi:protoheme IX farnesyltransferase
MKLRVVELLLVSTVPALFLAADGWPPLVPSLASIFGGTLAAGAANAFNMVIESETDALMGRTKGRPLVVGELTKTQANRFATLIMLLSLTIFWFYTTPLATLLTSIAIVFYVAIYTVGLKKRTDQNIVWGGIAGCMPALIGWAAVTNSLDLSAWLFFLVIFFWTPPHFWAIAIKYREDYSAAKIPMLPVVATHKRLKIEMWFHTIAMIVVSILLILAEQMPQWTLMMTIVLAIVFSQQLFGLKEGGEDQDKVASRIFNYSITYLTLYSLLLVVGVLLR